VITDRHQASASIICSNCFLAFLAQKRYTSIFPLTAGPGIPKEDLKKVFMAFCATKRNGMETGLYVIENIIRTYAGRSELEGELDGGSTFTVVLQ